jgi:hypothetical protein
LSDFPGGEITEAKCGVSGLKKHMKRKISGEKECAEKN